MLEEQKDAGGHHWMAMNNRAPIAMHLQTLVLLVVIAAPAGVISGMQPGPRVASGELTYAGRYTATSREFLGVPYAQAPVGRLRWSVLRHYSLTKHRLFQHQHHSVCLPLSLSLSARRPSSLISVHLVTVPMLMFACHY